jgi:hypothetical protein
MAVYSQAIVANGFVYCSGKVKFEGKLLIQVKFLLILRDPLLMVISRHILYVCLC